MKMVGITPCYRITLENGSYGVETYINADSSRPFQGGNIQRSKNVPFSKTPPKRYRPLILLDSPLRCPVNLPCVTSFLRFQRVKPSIKQRVWETSQQAKIPAVLGRESRDFTEKGTLFLCLLFSYFFFGSSIR